MKDADWFDHSNMANVELRNECNNRAIADMEVFLKEHSNGVVIFDSVNSTFDKRHNFLQMCVWVYYNADKKQILDFATKYLFDGNKEQATLFVDVFYPMSVTFINIYKSM